MVLDLAEGNMANGNDETDLPSPGCEIQTSIKKSENNPPLTHAFRIGLTRRLFYATL